MVPTLTRTLALKGHRPVVGSWDCKDNIYAFVALNVVTGRLTSKLIERLGRGKAPLSKNWQMQQAFCAHLKDIARAYPAHQHPRVVVVIDNAPWHGGKPVQEALRHCPHVELYRLPSYSPQLNVVERFWKVLRRRATHNRLFESLSALRKALRWSLSYYQTLKHKVRAIVLSDRKRKKLAAV